MQLNIACGNDYREGWVNIDKGNCRKDVDHDLENFPWPFGDNSVDYAFAKHFCEHLHKENFISFVRELYRICKHGASIYIEVPYFLSDNFGADPTHNMPFALRTFNYFDVNHKDDLRALGIIYGWEDIKFEVRSRLDMDRLDPGCNVIYNLRVVK